MPAQVSTMFTRWFRDVLAKSPSIHLVFLLILDDVFLSKQGSRHMLTCTCGYTCTTPTKCVHTWLQFTFSCLCGTAHSNLHMDRLLIPLVFLATMTRLSDCDTTTAAFWPTFNLLRLLVVLRTCRRCLGIFHLKSNVLQCGQVACDDCNSDEDCRYSSADLTSSSADLASSSADLTSSAELNTCGNGSTSCGIGNIKMSLWARP